MEELPTKRMALTLTASNESVNVERDTLHARIPKLGAAETTNDGSVRHCSVGLAVFQSGVAAGHYRVNTARARDLEIFDKRSKLWALVKRLKWNVCGEHERVVGLSKQRLAASGQSSMHSCRRVRARPGGTMPRSLRFPCQSCRTMATSCTTTRG